MSTLADLRAESLREQKVIAAEETALPAPDPSADAQIRKSASAAVRKQASAEARKRGSKRASEQAREEVSAPASAEARKDIPEPSTSDLAQRIRDAIAVKRSHAGGVKASVDMTPELSIRLKRYCLDHGNVPVRLVFLELAEAFLAEEGY